MADRGNVKRRRDNFCFAPGCKAGYKSSKEKLSLFQAPKDDELFEKWRRTVPRADKELQKHSALCELHFDEDSIVRTFTHVINNETVTLPRERPILAPHAVPTMFTNLPNVSKSTKAERQLLKRTAAAAEPTKKKRWKEISYPDRTIPEADTVPIEVAEQRREEMPQLDLGCLQLPAPYWSCHVIQSAPNTVAYSHCELSNTKSTLSVKKLVTFTYSEEEGALCKAFFREKEVERKHIKTTSEAQSILDESDKSHVCQGAGNAELFGSLLSNAGNAALLDGEVFSKQCAGKAGKKGQSCLRCKYLRKLLLTRKSKLKRKELRTSVPLRSKLRASTKKIKRLQRKLASLTKTISSMREETAAMHEPWLEEKIATLPKKQQLSVLHCFRASQRKTTHGMAYDQEWMLECIMMRMKSPRLYEHIRKHKILILPSRTCIQKYMKAYKSGFGLNPKTFEALSAKTKDMDVFHRHGGLVFDEIKLSEHFHVHTSGKIEGFVDLGAFTPDTEKHQPCDHGLVFLYQPFAQNWTQVVGVFASRGNVKAPLLSKILLEVIICCENAGLFVDYVTCDGATWNRQMWKLFNIKASVEKTTCSAQHPMDAQRRLHFLSDFPHLVKCVRNMFVKTGFDTPEGRVSKHWRMFVPQLITSKVLLF